MREGIRHGAELNTAFMLMNALAATNAIYGLLANSPAIIIGAMIVAMLLGPIAGIASALADQRPRSPFTDCFFVILDSPSLHVRKPQKRVQENRGAGDFRLPGCGNGGSVAISP